MSIESLGSAAVDTSAIALQRILQMSSEQSLDLAEKLMKVNAQEIISESQLGYLGQAIDILV